MKGQLKASTPEEYLSKLKEPRKSDIVALDALVQKATKLKPFIQMGILAYGPFHYKYKTGREGDWFRIGIASNASYISLYTCMDGPEGHVAERYKDLLPKADIGKSCVRFKKLADLDQSVLKKVFADCAKAKVAFD